MAIRIYVTRDVVDQAGGRTIYVTGHANTMVCAGVSGVLEACCRGLEWIAKRYPHQASYVDDTYAKPKRKPKKKSRR